MRFSQRIGIAPVKVDYQINSMDMDLRVSLWNCFELCYVSPLKVTSAFDALDALIELIWVDFFKSPVETISPYHQNSINVIKDLFLNKPWYDVYDFIEFIAKTNEPDEITSKAFMVGCNEMLEREVSAYRFVDYEIIQSIAIFERGYR